MTAPGRTRRGHTPASFWQPALVSVASVATTASVVAVPGAQPLGLLGHRRPVGGDPRGIRRRQVARPAARCAASRRPSAPNAAPTALTTTSAPTVAPEASTADAVPTPPRSPPVRAPVPAPTEPCATGPPVADAVGRGAVGRARVVQPGPATPEVEQDRRGHDGHPLVLGRPHRPAATCGVDLGGDTVGRCQPEGAAAGEHDGVDGGDEVAGVEQVGLAGAGAATAHVDAADRAGRRHDHGHPGEPPGLVTGGVADAHAGDVGDRVVGSGLHGPSMTDAGPAGAGPASGVGASSRPQCSSTAGGDVVGGRVVEQVRLLVLARQEVRRDQRER